MGVERGEEGAFVGVVGFPVGLLALGGAVFYVAAGAGGVGTEIRYGLGRKSCWKGCGERRECDEG